jgi:hypothetical protein
MVLPGLGVELSAGYLSVSESMTRSVTARGENGGLFSAPDFRDTTSLSGPLATIGASYRAFKRTPMTARASVGLALLNSSTTNSGTFSGGSGGDGPLTSPLAIAEVERRLLTPFGSTELRMGYRFTKQISGDLGVALMIFFPPNASRAGANSFSTDADRISPVPPNAATHSDVLTLPREEIAGTFLALAPSVTARFDF